MTLFTAHIKRMYKFKYTCIMKQTLILLFRPMLRKNNTGTGKIDAELFLVIDHVTFVYNMCDLVHSLASLAGKILYW